MKCPFVIIKCTKCGELLVANTINFYKKKNGKHNLECECKKCRNKRNKQYKKQYRKNHKEEISEYQRQYRENNKEHFKEYDKQYYENNPDKVFNNHNKRRQLEEEQGKGITKDQWLEMMEYFNWCCAYSGITLSKDTRSIDHIIALVQGGLNEIWNCVPMYKPYNSSKQDKDMLTWYKKQTFFSEERLEKIIKWQEYALNKWGDK